MTLLLTGFIILDIYLCESNSVVIIHKDNHSDFMQLILILVTILIYCDK